jgi:hypothetical protein
VIGLVQSQIQDFHLLFQSPELNSHQLETIKSLFGHYNWDINIEAESFVSENGGNTQDKCTQTESMETESYNFINVYQFYQCLQILFRFRFVVFRFISLCFVSHVTETPSVLMTVLSESMDRSQIRVYYPLLLQSIIYSEAEKEGPFKRHICIDKIDKH